MTTGFDETVYPPTIAKDPSAELDYWIDWAPWLAGDVPTSVAWTVPAGLTQPAAPTLVNGKATVHLGGGTVGESYRITCHMVVTPDVKEDSRSFIVQVARR